MRRTIITAAACAAVLAGLVSGSAAASHKPPQARAAQATGVTDLRLTASTPQLAACMPHAKVKVTDISSTEQLGFDKLKVRARGLAPDRDYTVFLLETAAAPFGAAQYLGTSRPTGTATRTTRSRRSSTRRSRARSSTASASALISTRSACGSPIPPTTTSARRRPASTGSRRSTATTRPACRRSTPPTRSHCPLPEQSTTSGGARGSDSRARAGGTSRPGCAGRSPGPAARDARRTSHVVVLAAPADIRLGGKAQTAVRRTSEGRANRHNEARAHRAFA